MGEEWTKFEQKRIDFLKTSPRALIKRTKKTNTIRYLGWNVSQNHSKDSQNTRIIVDPYQIHPKYRLKWRKKSFIITETAKKCLQELAKQQTRTKQVLKSLLKYSKKQDLGFFDVIHRLKPNVSRETSAFIIKSTPKNSVSHQQFTGSCSDAVKTRHLR